MDQWNLKSGETEPIYSGMEPTKAEDEFFSYTFNEWSRSEDVYGNISYTATYIAIPKT